MWKGKKVDLILVMIYFTVYAFGIHSLVTLKDAIENDVDFSKAIFDPFNILLAVFILMLCMSPAWVYFRKVPKMMTIDTFHRTLEIRKRKRTLKYNTDFIRFYQRQTTFFYILEIHATFDTRSKGKIEKMATSIIVPNWGLSWNKRVMIEVIDAFKSMDIEEINYRKHQSLSDYFYN